MDINSNTWKKMLQDGAKTMNISLSTEQIQLFTMYTLEIIQWNKTTNLTRITDPTDLAIKHFLDSLALSYEIEKIDTALKDINILDVGSGAGFPGIPIKIIFPSIQITLIDSSRKRVSFQKYIIRTLDLKGINSVHTRIEDYARDFQNKIFYDIIVSRAFTNLSDFFSKSKALLKNNGKIVAMKGKNVQKEIDKFSLKYEFIMNKTTYTLPLINQERILITGTKKLLN